MQWRTRPFTSGLTWCEQTPETANSRPSVWHTSTQVLFSFAAFFDSGGSSDTLQNRVNSPDKAAYPFVPTYLSTARSKWRMRISW